MKHFFNIPPFTSPPPGGRLGEGFILLGRLGRGLLFILLVLFVSCDRQERTDQGHTSACWIYAMCACIEHESVLNGDSVALSRQWLLARHLQEQTEQLFTTIHGHDSSPAVSISSPRGEAGRGLITTRGVGPEALRLIQDYGLVPYHFEETMVNNSRVMERKLTLLARQSRDMSTLRQRMAEILPSFSFAMPPVEDGWHASPASFYYLSMRYTPQQFAESLMYWIHYRWYAPPMVLTSSQRPSATVPDGSLPSKASGLSYVLNEPDNYGGHKYICASLPDILQRVKAALRQGHAVYWEYGEGHRSGHAVAIVGLQRDKSGKKLLLCLNSYGSRWGDKGYFTVTLEQFLKTTCNVGIPSSPLTFQNADSPCSFSSCRPR